MTERRRGLGRGLGALIPTSTDAQRPVDVFFPDVQGAAARAGAHTARTGAADSAPDAAATAPGTTVTGRRGDAGTSGEPGQLPVSDEAPDSYADVVSDTLADVSRGTTDLLPVPGARFAEIPVESIRPNSRQPRTVFDEDALEELVGSIREIGVLQPIVVRPAQDGQPGYELIMGERRWRATQRAGLSTVPAIVRETDDADLLRDALLENLHRSQLNPLEEAAAYQQLLDDFGCTHEELASRISRSRPQISNTLRLLRLPPLVQRRVAAGVLSAGHARALLGLADGAAIERLAQRIVAEGLSVRATEEIVSLGGDADRSVSASRRPRTGERVEAVDELAARLSDRFETRVKIAMGKSKGRITVEFASVQDLQRILTTLSPEDAALLGA